MKLTGVQKQAATRLDADVCLTSGAGCGKTTVLTARFINALAASDDVQVGDLVAITFTDKAARQMRDRIRRACRAMMGRAKEPAAKALWNQRLRDLDSARISTIHSFCGGLLRRFAVRAEVDPDFAVLEPLDADPLLEAAIDDVLRRRLADEADAGVRLLLEHYDLSALTASLTFLVSDKRDWIEHYIGPAASLDPAAMAAKWQEQTRAALVGIAREAVATGGLGKALAVLRQYSASDPDDVIEQKRSHFAEVADAFDATADDEEAIRLFTELLQMKGGPGGRKASWDADELAAVREALKAGTVARYELGELFAAGTDVPGVAGRLAVALLALVEDVAASYGQMKAARHAMDFKDLELGALRLLEGHEDVRREVAASARHVLIDEFQDTSWLQVRLAELICGERRGGGPPRLLVVGDAKQSIYRFRDAEIEQFERFAGTFPKDDQLDLAVSFRSHAGIIDFVNHFCDRFGGRLASELAAQRKEEPGQPGVEMLFVHPDDSAGKPSARQARAAEAAAVARRLRVLMDEKTPCVWDRDAKRWRAARPGDIAMLFRASSDMDLYEDALLAEGIPYYVVAGGGFYGQQEIVDVRNLLTALTEPADEVALLGALRSGLFALTDETLYWLCRQQRSRPGEMWTRLLSAGDLEGPTDQQRQRLAFAADTLAHLAGQVDRVPVAELLTDALRRTGYEAVTAALLDGRRRVGNLRRLVEQARRFDAAGEGGLAEFTQQIATLVDTEPREAQAATAAEADDVLRMMTIHAAKGLEFPIVVLADLNRRLPGRGQPIAALHPQFGLTVKLRDEQDELTATPPHRLAGRLDREADTEEEHRLLYVAATRAEDMLILAGTFPVERNTWLADLDERLELQLAEREHDGDIAYGDADRAMRLRVVYAGAPAAARAATPRRPDLFVEGILRQEKLDRFLRGADPAAVAEVLDACRPPAAPPRQVFGAKEIALAFAGERPLPQAGRMVFIEEPDEAISPSVRGLVLHRALQEYQWTGPGEAADLVRQAAAAMDVAGAGTVATLSAELRGQLERLTRTKLHATIAGSRDRRAEVRFLLKLGDARVRGAIDLLYQDGDGAWWVLDYKSDRIAADRIEAAAEKYALQIQLYALAASRHTQQAPVGAVLYFLQPGVPYRMDLSQADLEVAEENAVTTIRQLRRAEEAGRL